MTQESINFLNYFSMLDDPRIDSLLVYTGDEIILLTLCAVITGNNNWSEIQAYGEYNLEFLRELLPYKNGIPHQQTIKRFFNSIDHEYFSLCFAAWSRDLAGEIEGVIAIDGKTLSGSRSGSKKALHILSAFCHAQGLVIGQQAVDSKTNEITAIPELLNKLAIKGSVVTIDAMGTQKDIAEQIIKKEDDYMLVLKSNQESLYEDVKLLFEEQQANYWPDYKFSFYKEIDYGHGKISGSVANFLQFQVYVISRGGYAAIA